MNIVADESVDAQIVGRLRAGGHNVQYVAELDPGIDDDVVLFKGQEAAAVLLTADKDFGDLVFRQRLLHSGVVLIALPGWSRKERLMLSPGLLLSTIVKCMGVFRSCLRERSGSDR